MLQKESVRTHLDYYIKVMRVLATHRCGIPLIVKSNPSHCIEAANAQCMPANHTYYAPPAGYDACVGRQDVCTSADMHWQPIHGKSDSQV
uniref:Fructose-bisphosphate aldolase n=1 Tax=Pyxicephalus adspersus TaxID=30357 RepID=A0AAV3AY39_PYXAD|nr:TPA: hypothetical protein GDO54_011277 [Pyxicephalus adspersus]